MSGAPTTSRVRRYLVISGLSILVVLVGLALAAFIAARIDEGRERSEKAASDQHDAVVASMNRRAQETELANSNGAIAHRAKLAVMQQKIDQLSTNSDPGLQAVAAAEAAFTERLQAEMKIYAEGCDAVDEADVLNTASVKNKEMLATRRLAVRKFIAAAEGFKQFSIDIERIRRAELAKHNVPSELLETSMREFRKGIRRGNPLAIQMRDMDLKHGQALLGLIDLLEARWGTWRHESDNGLLVFGDDKDLNKYRELVKAVNDADAQRTLLRKRVQSLSK